MQWKGTGRGFELILSYCTETRVTSGYVKGTESAKLEVVLEQLKSCARPACHPFLLPILVLGRELSADNDMIQRDAREGVRILESVLSDRYQVVEAPGYVSEKDFDIDTVSRKLVEWQCRVMGKRPEAWRKVVEGLEKAMTAFWNILPQENKVPELRSLHDTLQSRLDFYKAKLEGLESYSHVTMERLNAQREVVCCCTWCSMVFADWS